MSIEDSRTVVYLVRSTGSGQGRMRVWRMRVSEPAMLSPTGACEDRKISPLTGGAALY